MNFNSLAQSPNWTTPQEACPSIKIMEELNRLNPKAGQWISRQARILEDPKLAPPISGRIHAIAEGFRDIAYAIKVYRNLSNADLIDDFEDATPSKKEETEEVLTADVAHEVPSPNEVFGQMADNQRLAIIAYLHKHDISIHDLDLSDSDIASLQLYLNPQKDLAIP